MKARNMTDIVFLYCTAPNAGTAGKIAQSLIGEGLAACVNIMGEARSIYEWEGNIEEAAETPFIVKTTAGAAEAARNRILEVHPFDCPCVAALPVNPKASSDKFLKWIAQTTTA